MENNLENPRSDRFCARCGAVIEGDNFHDFNGEIYCNNCYQTDTVTCSHCGERILWEDNAGEESLPLCRDCYTDHYTICQGCGRVIHQEDAHYHNEYDEDSAYCDNCFVDDDDDDGDCSIHDYSYKPTPIFYGSGSRFFGVELEIDDGGKDDDNAESLLEIANVSGEKIYIKSDGSLDDGMEIVTHPMSLEFHKNKMPWEEIMETAISFGYKSHKTRTCGLHVHVNRNTFGDTREAQDDAISRVLYFVEHHWNEMLKFSRRTEEQMSQWAARYGYKNNPKDILDHAKNECDNRSTCVNITNYNTVEFRMFRGTLRYNPLIATLELVYKICEIAVNCNDKSLAKMSWTDFVMSLPERDCMELLTYLKERRLYVNSPICGEEDE